MTCVLYLLRIFLFILLSRYFGGGIRGFTGFFPFSLVLGGNVELKEKPLSLGAKILGAIIAIGALVLKAALSPTLDIDAALKVAAFVVLVFVPIDVSMIMDNIFNNLHGGGQ
jgi:hypothetical protein